MPPAATVEEVSSAQEFDDDRAQHQSELRDEAKLAFHEYRKFNEDDLTNRGWDVHLPKAPTVDAVQVAVPPVAAVV